MSRVSVRRSRRSSDGRRAAGRARLLVAAIALASSVQLTAGIAPALAGDPFVDEVVSFEPGAGAGFGQDAMPEVVLGPPQGGGLVQQSLDVVSLGDDGQIVVRFDEPVVCDGAGADFTVFENPFHAGSEDGPVFVEAGIVAVSQDGETFFEFPYDAGSFAGLAGVVPVLSNPTNGVEPTDPSVSGGDPFDLAAVGLPWAAYVRITDPGAVIADPGNLVPPGTKGGFDLDAIAIVHPCGSVTTSTLLPGSTTTTVSSTSTTTSTMPQHTTTTTSTTSTLPSGPLCGDGAVEGPETCDDGDTVWQPGQSCDADCTHLACGDSDGSGASSAVDALMALRAAVGAAACDACLCDVDGGSGSGGNGVNASDALRLLRFATGIAGIALACPPCP